MAAWEREKRRLGGVWGPVGAREALRCLVCGCADPVPPRCLLTAATTPNQPRCRSNCRATCSVSVSDSSSSSLVRLQAWSQPAHLPCTPGASERKRNPSAASSLAPSCFPGGEKLDVPVTVKKSEKYPSGEITQGALHPTPPVAPVASVTWVRAGSRRCGFLGRAPVGGADQLAWAHDYRGSFAWGSPIEYYRDATQA